MLGGVGVGDDVGGMKEAWAVSCLGAWVILAPGCVTNGGGGGAGTSTGLPYAAPAAFEPASTEVPRAWRAEVLGPVSKGGTVPRGERSTATDWRAGAARWLGAPHRVGGMDRSGMDGAGLARVMHREIVGWELPSTTVLMWEGGRGVAPREIQPGDLVFFSRSSQGDGVAWVGVAVGDGRFVHVSPVLGVREDRWDTRFWQERWMGARRWAE